MAVSKTTGALEVKSFLALRQNSKLQNRHVVYQASNRKEMRKTCGICALRVL